LGVKWNSILLFKQWRARVSLHSIHSNSSSFLYLKNGVAIGWIAPQNCSVWHGGVHIKLNCSLIFFRHNWLKESDRITCRAETRGFCVCVFCWRCVSIHLCNKNQLDAVFILSLFPSRTGQQTTKKHDTYRLFYIYSIPPDDGLQICPKHVEFDWHNKLMINQVGFHYTDVSRCTVNKTWNLTL